MPDDKKIISIIHSILVLIFISLIAIFILNFYCELFAHSNSLAKIRLVNNPIIFLIITPLLFWVSAYICRKFAPYAAGNSIMSVKIALEDLQYKANSNDKVLSLLNLKIIIVKAISSLLCVFAGGAMGREGPTVHMSAALFAVTGNKFMKYSKKITLEAWIIAGSAIGVAIAFHAPLTGFIYALEKSFYLKTQNYKTKLIWFKNRLLKLKTPNFFLSLCYALIAVFIYKITNEAKLMFNAPEANFIYSYNLCFVAILSSFICSFLALFLKAINFNFYYRFQEIKSNFWHFIPITLGLMVAINSYYAGIYSFGGGVFTTNHLLENTEMSLSLHEVMARYFNIFFTFISGCAGGLIAPAIAVGAGVGSVISQLYSDIDTNILIVMSMTAFLSAIIGSPITAAIMILEVTGQSYNILPILLIISILANLFYMSGKKYLCSVKYLQGKYSYFKL